MTTSQLDLIPEPPKPLAVVVATAPPVALDPASLETWLATLHPLHRAGRSEATWRAYGSDLAHFSTWCADRGHQPLPALPETVMAYIADLGGTYALSTLRRRLAAISVAHRLIGAPSPTADEMVRLAWAGLSRTYGPGRQVRRVEAIETSVLVRLVAPLGNSAMDHRDRALLVIGFAGAFRRSELSGLDVGDIAVTPDGLRITLRVSKTDQEGEGQVKGLPYGSHRETCPVRSWQAWIEASNIDVGPAFRSMTKGGKSLKSRRLSGQSIAQMIKRRAADVGLDPREISGHSLRAGFATAAARAGVPDRSIMRQTGHRSPGSLAPYVREGTLFDDNPAAHVGL